MTRRPLEGKASIALLAFLALALAPRSQAGIIFQTGFESTGTPPYSLGQFSGQNGWGGVHTPVVENSTVFSGSQAVAFDTVGVVGQNLMGHLLTYNSLTSPDKTVVFDIHFMESTTGSESDWDPLVAFGNGGLLNQVVVQNNGIVVLGGHVHGLPYTRGTWNDIRMTVDFSNDMVYAYLNSQFLGSSGFFAGPSTSLKSFELGLNGRPAGDTGYFDQLSVTSTTPEPACSGLLAAGIGLLALRKRKTRRP